MEVSIVLAVLFACGLVLLFVEFKRMNLMTRDLRQKAKELSDLAQELESLRK